MLSSEGFRRPSATWCWKISSATWKCLLKTRLLQAGALLMIELQCPAAEPLPGAREVGVRYLDRLRSRKADLHQDQVDVCCFQETIKSQIGVLTGGVCNTVLPSGMLPFVVLVLANPLPHTHVSSILLLQ